MHQILRRLLAIAPLVASVVAAGMLAACSHHDEAIPAEPEVVDPPCVFIPPSNNLLGYSYQIPDRAVWWAGCFNPTNADEAAVVASLPGLNGIGYGLFRLDLRTGQRTLLYEGIANQNAEWSRTGWIAFLRGGEAWKVKANGDSAAPFTASNRKINSIESWSPDGRQLLCYRNGPIYAQTGFAIYTAQGAFVRLLPDATLRAYMGVNWSPDGRRLVYAGGPATSTENPRLCLYDLATNRLDTLDVLPRTVQLDGVRWLPNGREVVWSANTGISITDIQTHRTRLLRGTCPVTISGAQPSHSFGYAYPSGDGQRILVSRGDRAVSPTDPELLIEKYSLETMNPQGGQIRRITP